MENLIATTSVPVIVCIVYGALSIFRSVVTNKKLIGLIPVFAAVMGAMLGVLAFYAAPAIIPAENILVAILIGGTSGLAATGTNQIYKQLCKLTVEEKTSEPDAEDTKK